jgi:hypothetical protein
MLGFGFYISMEPLSMGHLILKPLSFFLVMRVLMHLWQKVCPHMVSNLGGFAWVKGSLH